MPVEGAEEMMVEVHVQGEEAELQQDVLIVEEEEDDMQAGQRLIGGGRCHHGICSNVTFSYPFESSKLGVIKEKFVSDLISCHLLTL